MPFGSWAGTKRTLHMCCQLMGKSRLALSPPRPQWLGAALSVGTRGLTTGPMPWGTDTVEVSLDVIDHHLRVCDSRGREVAIAMTGLGSVAEMYAALLEAYATLGVHVDIWDRPQEVADVTPFSSDHRPLEYDPPAARTWWQVTSAFYGVLEQWRSPFLGRNPVAFWWGGFDLGAPRFTGRPVAPPRDRGYIMRYDLDAQHMNAGLWFGDDSAPEPVIYLYLYPAPPQCSTLELGLEQCAWDDGLQEWVLPYHRAIATPDPRRTILEALDRVWELAGQQGGWDVDRCTYARPHPSARGEPAAPGPA